MKASWRHWFASTPSEGDVFSIDDSVAEDIEQLRQRAAIPRLWLFGKTGSGKSSVVQFLTGAEEATVGEGYRPETRASRRFDFPDAEDPLLTFIDTRGLAEAKYDPNEDIERFSSSTQLMIITVRVSDHAIESVVGPLRQIRQSCPERPVLLVLTCLHEVAGAENISESDDPFEPSSTSRLVIPRLLQTLIEEKSTQFAGLFDAVIPVDFTRIEDGFAEPNFGGSRLKSAILDQLPHAYRQALLALNESGTAAMSARQRRVHWQVLASSALAATAGAVPLPWVDIPVVLGIQTHLAMRIAKVYDMEITPARWAVLSSAAGGRIAIRLAIRGALKFIPWAGMAVGAASSFAFTYALGMSWDWYFADLRRGHMPTANQLQQIFAQQLRRGQELWKAQ